MSNFTVTYENLLKTQIQENEESLIRLKKNGLQIAHINNYKELDQPDTNDIYVRKNLVNLLKQANDIL